MRINITAMEPNRGGTKSFEDFSEFLSLKPKSFGTLAKFYKDYSTSMLTDALGNIFYRDAKAKDKYLTVNNMIYEWNIEVHNIEKVEFAEVPVGDGANNTEIEFCTRTKGFDRYDIFVIEATRQQVIVVSIPVQTGKGWKFRGRLIDNTGASILDLSGCQIGQTARFQSNAHPETHREGYTKQMYNVEKYRNCITIHRTDMSKTGLYAINEDMLVKVTNNEEGCETSSFYKLTKGDKALIDNFMFVRNNGNLFNKTNLNPVTGKPTTYDPVTGYPIYIANGIVPQVEAYAGKLLYNKLTEDSLRTALNILVERASNPIGNVFVCVCNSKGWSDIQILLGKLFKKSDKGAVLYSEKYNQYVKVGNTFEAYEFGGNVIEFKVEKAFTTEFGNEKGYFMFLDVTGDELNNQSAIKNFTIEGGDFLKNRVLGVGGADGRTSGDVSVLTSGVTDVIHGYSSTAVIAPFKSFILAEV